MRRRRDRADGLYRPLDLSDSQFQKPQNLAKVHGIATEVLLKVSLEDWLNLEKGDFINAAECVLTKKR